MGKYGLSPEDLVYIVNNEEYYNLISDAAFSDVSEVGNDTAMKLIGAVGSLYGTPVIVTDTVSRAAGKTAAVAVAKNNYVIPRLKGVSIETDYEVAGQRTAVVAAQSLGFGELVDAAGGNLPSVRIQYSG